MKTLLIGLLVATVATPAQAQRWKTYRYDVTIIGRQQEDGTYTYAVPGMATALNGGTTVLSTPGFLASYQVTGATLSLQLPDGRIAVVNCAIKANHSDWTGGRYRSCRVPLVNTLRVEFSGDNAKLLWPVSVDGKTMQNETYKILGILDKR